MERDTKRDVAQVIKMIFHGIVVNKDETYFKVESEGIVVTDDTSVAP